MRSWSGPATAPNEVGLALSELFERQVAADPLAVAISGPSGEWTYVELNSRANRLARLLAARGVLPGHHVVVALPATPDLAVVMLAILKVGAAYVPIDPCCPTERLATLLADAAPTLVIRDAQTPWAGVDLSTSSLLISDPATHVELAKCAEENLTESPSADHAAYVIYTSGSTGAPKGVVVTQADIVALALDHRFDAPAHHRVLVHSPHTFDAFTYELWVPLLHGGTAVLTADFGPDIGALANSIAAGRVSALFLTTRLFELIAHEEPECLAGVQQVWTGGEQVPAESVRRIFARCPATTVIDVYGPTETTVFATCHRMTSTDPVPELVPIGHCLDGVVAHVLDAALRPVPAGDSGELYLKGAGVALGYLNRPDLTAQRFVACPFGAPGERMYRTGDIVRQTANGAMVFQGRADDQVKLRGFRIEPGEVETAILRQPGVTQAAVVVCDNTEGDRLLVGYVVRAATGVPPEIDVLRQSLSRILPDFMVPSILVQLDALPLTPNGKTDRAQLARRPLSRNTVATTAAPKHPLQNSIADMWAHVLGIAAVGIDENLFEIGANSLHAARIAHRIRRSFGVDIALQDIYEAPTVATLAASVAAAERSPLETKAIMHRRPARLPLSDVQTRLWHLNQLNSIDPSYHLTFVARLHGALDCHALDVAIADLITRHESLRTIFPAEAGVPQQKILPPWEIRVDLVVENVAVSAIHDRIGQLTAAPFDLTIDAPVRASLLCTGTDEYALVMRVHHIACDGWSVYPLFRDLEFAYRARTAGAPPAWQTPAPQYADFTLNRSALLGLEDVPGSEAHRQLSFWRDSLRGMPAQLLLPADRPRPTTPSSRGGRVEMVWNSDLHWRLTAFAHQSRASLLMVLQAGLAALMTRYGAGYDIPLGTVVAGRADPQLNDMVGFVVNTLVLRTDTAGDPSFEVLLDRVRHNTFNALEHQEISFDRVVGVLNPPRLPGRHPLFQVALALQNMDWPTIDLTGTPARIQEWPTGGAKFDLLFEFWEHHDAGGRPGGITCIAEFSTDLFEPATAQRLLESLRVLLSAMVNDPGQPIGRLALAVPQAPQQAASVDQLPKTGLISEVFEHQVARYPDAIAMRYVNGQMSYRQLNSRANQLARLLVSRGAGPERIVALALPRSPDLLVATLAVAKSGGAYLLLDPTHPASRLATVLTDARPTVVVTASAHRLLFSPNDSQVIVLDDPQVLEACTGYSVTDLTDSERNIPLRRQHAAQLIYTSGTTGTPKGDPPRRVWRVLPLGRMGTWDRSHRGGIQTS